MLNLPSLLCTIIILELFSWSWWADDDGRKSFFTTIRDQALFPFPVMKPILIVGFEMKVCFLDSRIVKCWDYSRVERCMSWVGNMLYQRAWMNCLVLLLCNTREIPILPLLNTFVLDFTVVFISYFIFMHGTEIWNKERFKSLKSVMFCRKNNFSGLLTCYILSLLNIQSLIFVQ